MTTTISTLFNAPSLRISVERPVSVNFEELYKNRRPVYIARAMKYLPSRAHAEDMVQELFIKMYKSADSYGSKGSIEAWSDRVLTNMCLDYLNVSKRRSEIELDLKVTRKPKQPDQILQRKQIEELIESLPKGCRKVLKMYAIQGYSHPEIAEALGLAESTSRTQLMKAKSRLKDMMGKSYSPSIIKAPQ